MATKPPKPRMPKTGRELAESVFEAHLEQLSRHVERNGIRGLRKLYAEARDELQRRLRRAGPLSKSVEATTLRAMIAQVDAVLGKLGASVRKHLESVSHTAVEMGARHGVDEFRVLSKVFTGTTPVIGVDVGATFRGLVKGIDRSLLRRYRLQSQTWALRAIDQMERQLSVATMTGKPLETVIDDVMGLKGFEGERWQAERIVRTESHYAHQAAKHRAVELTAKELDEPLWKRLIETFDDRTGDDSFLLHGQTVPANKPFRWKHKKQGRWIVTDFMHPPNRPNDRAVMIPWDPSWKAERGEKPLTRAQLRAARPTRWRKTPGVEVPPKHDPYPYGRPKV